MFVVFLILAMFTGLGYGHASWPQSSPAAPGFGSGIVVLLTGRGRGHAMAMGS